MIKRKYIKRAYIEEAYCNKCGTAMEFTGMVLTSYPQQYPYHCPKCKQIQTFMGDTHPGIIKYEFYEEDETFEGDNGWDTK